MYTPSFIITTHDELYQGDYLKKEFKSIASKEVHNYSEALRWGFEIVRKKDVLNQIGIVQKVKLGRHNYYINTDLYNLLSNINLIKHV